MAILYVCTVLPRIFSPQSSVYILLSKLIVAGAIIRGKTVYVYIPLILFTQYTFDNCTTFQRHDNIPTCVVLTNILTSTHDCISLFVACYITKSTKSFYSYKYFIIITTVQLFDIISKRCPTAFHCRQTPDPSWNVT